MNVLKVNDVDISKVCISETKGKKTKISYVAEDDELFKFKVQTGKMRIPWDTNNREYDGRLINIELCASTHQLYNDDDENKKNVRMFKELVSELEKMHPDAGSELKLSSVLYGKNPMYSPTIKMSIPIADLKPDVSVFNSGGKSIEFDNVKKGAVCSFIVRISHFWTSSKTYGIQLVVEQIMVFSSPKEQSHVIVSDSD